MEGGKGGKKKLAESWSGEGLYCSIHRVPECLSSKRECLPLGPRGRGQHKLADEGVGGANSDDCTESLALCALCG